MSGTADLDRTILAWIRDGEAEAPAHLASEIRRAIEAAPPQRNGLRWTWSLVQDRSLRSLAPLILLGAAATVVALALLLALGSPHRPAVLPNQSPSASSAPSPSPSATPFGTEPTDQVAPATEEPQPTDPAARSWSIAGVGFDLPAGWSDPPSGEYLAIRGALDQLGDPYAGIFNLVFDAGRARTVRFLFHVTAIGSDPDAGIRVWTSGSQGTTPALEADRVSSILERQGSPATRTTVKLPIGRAVVLDWDVVYRGPDLHYRAYLVPVSGSVIRVDFATVGLPSHDLAAEFLRIMRSLRAEPASG